MQDEFDLMLRRQGWRLTGYAPIEGDARVIKWQAPVGMAPSGRMHASFYEALHDKTLRKVLREIFTRQPALPARLSALCSNEARLNRILSYLEAGGVIVRGDEAWMRGPDWRSVQDTGATFEWCVAEWFRRELQVPARQGVKLQEIRGGGDLDLVAFLADIRVYAECKTGWPDEMDIRQFLQRVQDFRPELAILLVDTDSSVQPIAQIAASIIDEMYWLRDHPDAGLAPDEVKSRTGKPVARVAPGYAGLYSLWGRALLSGVPNTIGASLSAALRFYYSYLRHLTIREIPHEWNFVNRKAPPLSNDIFGVEGEVRI